MELNNENMKKIRHLIVFTALIILCFWKYDMVIQAVKFVISVLFPFILGGAIAFVFNVPMHFIENRLIQEKWKKKYMKQLQEENLRKRKLRQLLVI